MRVRAKTAGHINGGITVTRRGKEITADLILQGDEFDWPEDNLGNWMEPASGEAAPMEMNKREVMNALDAAGIKYFKGADIDALRKLLPPEV